MIISVKEARKILGKDAEKIDDNELEQLIITLDEIAKASIKIYFHTPDNDT